MSEQTPKDFGKFINDLPQEEMDKLNQKQHEEHKKEYKVFYEALQNEKCYMCNQPLDYFVKTEPCLHWLLRKTNKFKSKHFQLISKKYNYSKIAVYLRWVANSEKFQVNINDMKDEQSEKKIFQSTIVWKNIEWSFECSEKDFKGHEGTASNFPHYHFQMRINEMPFINYNSNHNKFDDEDLALIHASIDHNVKLYFGPFGEGMQDAVSVPVEEIIDKSRALKVGEENTGAFSFTSFISNPDGIDMDLFQDAVDESRETGKSLQKLLQEKLDNQTKIATIVTPSDNVPKIAKRTEHENKKKR